MADVAAQLTVVIDAIDNASGVIAGVAAELGGLGSIGNTAAGSTAAVNSALDNTARSGTAAGSALTTAAKGSIMFSTASARTASSTEQLTQRLETQKNTTRQYAAEVRNSAAVLRNKQAAVRDAAIAYKANTAPLKENISTLQNQQTALKSTITSRQNEIAALTEANKSLKKSSQTYKDNQKAIQWTRVELSDAQQKYRAVSAEISTQEKALKAEESAYKAAQTEVKAAARSHEELRTKMHDSSAAEKELTTAIENGDTALTKQQRVASNSAQAQSALVQSQEKVISTAEQWKTSGKNLKEFGEGVDTLTKPLQAAAVAAVGLGIATGKAAVDFEDNFAAVEKTVDGTPEQLENIKQGIIDMTTVGINGHSAIPQTTADLTELAAAGGQLGVQTENILDFTETMAMLGTATNLSGEAGAKTLARFMNVTNTAQSDISRLGSTIVDLGNNFATTEAEIANMAMDMGATGSEIGMSTQDILGYATALSSMGIEAAAGGSALQRIWMDMQNAVSSGGDSLEAFAKISGKSSKGFQEQWKKDASGAFRDFLKGLNESEDQVGLLTALGFNNVRDQRALMALAGEKGFNILTEAINRANKAWNENTALQNEFDKKAETTKSQIEVTKSNVIEAARSFGEVLLPEVAAVTGGIADFAKGLADMDEGSKKAVITGAKSAIILGAVAKGTTSVIKGTGNLIESIGKIKGAFATGGVLAEVSPTLGAIATGAGPAVLGLAAVAAATYGMAKAAKAFEDYRADWSRGGDELTAELKSHVDAARELNELQYELRTLNQITSNPDTNAEDLEAAQARINEIKQTLAQKYHMDIEVDSSQLDAALEKQKELEYYDAVGRVPKQLNYLDDKKDDYEKAKEGIAKAKENIAAIEAEQDATRRLRADLVSLKEKYDKGQISQKEFTQGIKELAEAAGNPYLADTPIDALINGDAIDDWAERLQDYLKTNTDTLANGEATLAEYVKSAEELADTGLMQMEWGKTEQGLANIASAVKYAGLNVDEYAKKASNVETGVTSMSEAVQSAWEGNGEVLDKYIGNYMNFAQKFGASTEQAVEGAALIKEGFSSVAEVGNNADNIQAVLNSLQQLGSVQGLDMNAEKLTEMAHEMKLLPDNMHIEFDAEGKITWKSEEPPEPDVPDAEGTVNYETGEVEKPEDLTVEGTVNWTIAGTEMTQMPTFDKWLKQNTDTNTTITPTVTVDATILNTKGEKKGSGSILDWLFPSASAAELDDTSVTGQTATITQDITVVPGSIDVEAVTSTLTQAMDLVGAMETSEVNATVSVTVTPGSIDVSALTSTMSQATQADAFKHGFNIGFSYIFRAVPCFNFYFRQR